MSDSLILLCIAAYYWRYELYRYVTTFWKNMQYYTGYSTEIPVATTVNHSQIFREYHRAAVPKQSYYGLEQQEWAAWLEIPDRPHSGVR